ncbi:unnamed protein product [Spirodela intermedia]|uniref:Uncharacterized protein n=1 Tax=Spirodela intermedia TaxID=51605 RepID=A0A7I8IQ32_SPIIN|nr:unnamed protein product [Spirodela intermedia]CAA6659101.1 unnamed protein product [Spirodela intermedia]
MNLHGVAITFNLLLFFSFLYGSVESLRSEEEHDRSYHDLFEREKRFNIFKSNILFIDENNHLENNHSFTLGLNHFADLSNEEYRSLYVHSPLNMSDLLSTDEIVEPPPKSQLRQQDSWDWRDHGVVKSCWAFTAVATIESINAHVTGDLITLSEQELVDCDMFNGHCKLGYISNAYEYIIKNGGIDTDINYPYQERKGVCKIDRDQVVTIDGHGRCPKNQESALKHFVRRQPIATGIDASSAKFQLYKIGVFDGFCTTQVNHAVTIVGYGVEQGYAKLRRNILDPRGKCGIASWTFYPKKVHTPKSNKSLFIEEANTLNE